MSEDVLYHHDSAVHHHADADSQPPQTHQVGRQARHAHGNERKEYRQRQCRHHDQCGTNISEEQIEKNQYQNRTFKQCFLDSAYSLAHQVCLRVIRFNLQPLWEGLVQIVDFRIDVLKHLTGVGANQFHHVTAHGFLTRGHLCPTANRWPKPNLRHILDVNRGLTLTLGHNDVLDVFDAFVT